MYKECEECGQMWYDDEIEDGLCPDCLANLGPDGYVRDEDGYGDEDNPQLEKDREDLFG